MKSDSSTSCMRIFREGATVCTTHADGGLATHWWVVIGLSFGVVLAVAAWWFATRYRRFE